MTLFWDPADDPPPISGRLPAITPEAAYRYPLKSTKLCSVEWSPYALQFTPGDGPLDLKQHQCHLLDVGALCAHFQIAVPRQWPNKKELVKLTLPRRKVGGYSPVAAYLVPPGELYHLLDVVTAQKLLAPLMPVDGADDLVSPAYDVSLQHAHENLAVLGEMQKWSLEHLGELPHAQRQEALRRATSTRPRLPVPRALVPPGSLVLSKEIVLSAFKSQRPALEKLAHVLAERSSSGPGLSMEDFVRLLMSNDFQEDFQLLFEAFDAFAGVKNNIDTKERRTAMLLLTFVRAFGRTNSQQYNFLHDDLAAFLYFHGASNQCIETLHTMGLCCSNDTLGKRIDAEAAKAYAKAQELLDIALVLAMHYDNATWTGRNRALTSDGGAFTYSPNTVAVLKRPREIPAGLSLDPLAINQPDGTTLTNPTIFENGVGYEALRARGLDDLLEETKHLLLGNAVLDKMVQSKVDRERILEARPDRDDAERSVLSYDEVLLRLSPDGLGNSHTLDLLVGHNPGSGVDILSAFMALAGDLGEKVQRMMIVAGDQPIAHALRIGVAQYNL